MGGGPIGHRTSTAAPSTNSNVHAVVLRILAPPNAGITVYIGS
jgi:hypothetical protein